jgi:MFS family permease
LTTLAVPAPVEPAWKKRLGLYGLVTAEAVSTIGGRMTFLAIPWLVLVTTGSPVKVGIVAGVETLPYVLSGVLAAPLQDRLGARLTSIGADILSAGALVAITVLGQLHFDILLVLVALAGMLRAQADRSKNNLMLPTMQAAGTDFTRVAAARDGTLKSSMLLGASLGGVVIVAFGATGALLFDAATFIFAAVVVSVTAVRPPATTAADGETAPPVREPYFTALRNGFAGFRQDRLLRKVTGMLFFTNLFNQASAVVFVPLWVMTVLHSPAALGAVSAAYAIGLIIGNIVFAWLAPVLPKYPVLVAGYFIGGAPRFLVLALSDDITVVVIVTLISGIAMCSVNPTIGASIYKRIPADMLARVGGIITAVAFGGMPLGGIIGGASVEWLGLTNGILACTALYFCVTLAPVAGYRIWRELNDLSAKKPTPDGATALPQIYGLAGIATGPRLTLRYADGDWTLFARHGVKRLVRRQPVEPKTAVSALTQVDVVPVQEAVREVLEHDRALAARRTRLLRARTARLESTLTEINEALRKE